MAGNRPEESESASSGPISNESEGSEAVEVGESGKSALAVETAEGAFSIAEGLLPDRYIVKESEQGQTLSCREAPNVTVRIERGLSINGPAARKYPPGTIFLDGVAQDSPFLDTERHLYNLDHHEACVRSFTLSTCEQAYILIRRGLELKDRDWTVYANDPDLDTVFAIWVLLNYRRLIGDDDEIRIKILPLLRLEGVIDVHGLEMQELACFSSERHRETSRKITSLLDSETELKRANRWGEISFSEYTADVLRRIDEMVYSPWHFDDFQEIDEVARIEITDKHIAVICRSEAGIYEVERQLSAVHEGRLGMVVLQKDEKTYTLRQTNLFLPVNLKRVYSLLNMIDSNAGRGSPENLWGGSADIGGSPRATGTALSAPEIAEGILRAFHRPSGWQILSTTAVTLICTTMATLLGWLAGQIFAEQYAFGAGFLSTSLLLLLLFSRQYPRVYGLRLPVARDWIILLPIAAAATFLGGIWLPQGLVGESTPPMSVLYLGLMAAGLPLAAEVLFRGLIHGLWTEELRAQRSGGRWFVSWPTIVSAMLYAAATILPLMPLEPVRPLIWPAGYLLTGYGTLSVTFLAALVFGLALGMARERSESLTVPLLFHWLCIGLVLLAV